MPTLREHQDAHFCMLCRVAPGQPSRCLFKMHSTGVLHVRLYFCFAPMQLLGLPPVLPCTWSPQRFVHVQALRVLSAP